MWQSGGPPNGGIRNPGGDQQPWGLTSMPKKKPAPNNPRRGIISASPWRRGVRSHGGSFKLHSTNPQPPFVPRTWVAGLGHLSMQPFGDSVRGNLFFCSFTPIPTTTTSCTRPLPPPQRAAASTKNGSGVATWRAIAFLYGDGGDERGARVLSVGTPSTLEYRC